jgi:hypothetical protein
MISKKLMRDEMLGVIETLKVWVSVLNGDSPVPGSPTSDLGIPFEDFPGSEERRAEAYRQLSSELVICAGKCENLADVVFPSR